MQKKQFKGYLLLALSVSVIYACGPKQPATVPPPIQQQPVESLDPNAPIPGLDDFPIDPGTDPGTDPLDPGVDPGTIDPGAVEPTTDPAATADPAATPTPTADPNATPTPSPTPSPSPTAGPTATPAPVTCDLKVSGDLSVLAGTTKELTAEEKCSDGTTVTDTYNWTSSDTAIATVDASGKVTGVKAGNVNITATSKTTSSKKSTVQFTVSATCQISMSGNLVNNTTMSLNSAQQLTATVKCSDGKQTTSEVNWTTSDSGVATVNTNGLVEGHKIGNAKITATYRSDSSIKTELNISVNDPFGNDERAILAEGQLNQPKGIAVKSGRIYVTHDDIGSGLFNVAEGMVLTFDLSGNKVKDIAGSTGDVLPRELTGVATDGSRVWMVNRIPYAQSQNIVYSFDTNSTARQNARLGLTGAAGTDFKDIAIDPSTSTLYVSSGGVRSVIKANYDTSGIKTETQQLYFAGQNLSPAGISVDNFGNLLVVNQGSTHTVMKFGKDGNKVLEFNTTGKNSSGPVGTMLDVAYDQNNGGMFYVLAQVSGSNVILRYDNNGNFVRKFGNMQDPTAIAVGEDGTVYVADKGKKAIYQFAPGR